MKFVTVHATNRCRAATARAAAGATVSCFLLFPLILHLTSNHALKALFLLLLTWYTIRRYKKALLSKFRCRGGEIKSVDATAKIFSPSFSTSRSQPQRCQIYHLPSIFPPPCHTCCLLPSFSPIIFPALPAPFPPPPTYPSRQPRLFQPQSSFFPFLPPLLLSPVFFLLPRPMSSDSQAGFGRGVFSSPEPFGLSFPPSPRQWIPACYCLSRQQHTHAGGGERPVGGKKGRKERRDQEKEVSPPSPSLLAHVVTCVDV